MRKDTILRKKIRDTLKAIRQVKLLEAELSDLRDSLSRNRKLPESGSVWRRLHPVLKGLYVVESIGFVKKGRHLICCVRKEPFDGHDSEQRYFHPSDQWLEEFVPHAKKKAE